jgi:hypothetical protein
VAGATFHLAGTPVVKCRPDVTLAPGVNRFPVAIPTFYGHCSPPQAGDRTRTPTCRPTGRPPPLPPGAYVTKYLIRCMPAGFRQPAPLTVTLRAGGGDGASGDPPGKDRRRHLPEPLRLREPPGTTLLSGHDGELVDTL